MFRFTVRNLVEFAIIGLVWLATTSIIQSQALTPVLAIWLVIAVSFGKAVFFGGENLQQLWRASSQNMAYHRFMLVMLVNMSQIILSFGLDFYCLHQIDPLSFGSVAEGLGRGDRVFEFVWYSVLNFTFFGFGDVTPQTIPAKLLTMSEILLAFVTVIFLLSDFVSLKESIRPVSDSKTKQESGPRQ